MKKKAIYLIVLVALMITSLGVVAQNGLTPLVGSTHVYTVTAGSGTKAWTVVQGTAGTEYAINSGVNTASANITWNVAGTYTLEFRETAATGSCIGLVTTTVVVGANTFDVWPSTTTATCNGANNIANITGNYLTHVTFTVNMTTGSSWSPTWEFTFTLAGTAGALSNVKVDGSTQSGTGPYTVTGITSTLGVKTVTVECDITGDVNTLQQVALNITSAKELIYNTPENNALNNSATQIINALPTTTPISAN